jgi:hypothetical protein
MPASFKRSAYQLRQTQPVYQPQFRGTHRWLETVTYSPPIFAAEYESSWTTTTSPKTVSVTTAVGDVLVVTANCHTTETIAAPTGGTGLSWTLQQSIVNISTKRTMYAWTATATTAETFTMSVARTGTLEWGYSCFRYSGSLGIGASAQAEGGLIFTQPTFVAEYETAWNTTTSPKTVSVTTAVGDVLVCYGMTADGATTLNTPTGGTGLSWTLRQSAGIVAGNRTPVYIWTATATTAQTLTLSMTRNGTTTWQWGFNCLRFSGSSGIGASSSTIGDGGPSLNLTTTQDNSAVVVANSDFAVVATARTWRTTAGAFTEQTYSTVSGQMTVYGGYHPTVGTAGSKTVGLSAPATQTYSIAAVEVLGISTVENAPSVLIGTVQDRSAVVVHAADFSAVDGASRSWRTEAGVLTETTYDRVVGKYTTYAGYHADAGLSGSYLVGLTAPNQIYSIMAIEVLGSPVAVGPSVAQLSGFMPFFT